MLGGCRALCAYRSLRRATADLCRGCRDRYEDRLVKSRDICSIYMYYTYSPRGVTFLLIDPFEVDIRRSLERLLRSPCTSSMARKGNSHFTGAASLLSRQQAKHVKKLISLLDRISPSFRPIAQTPLLSLHSLSSRAAEGDECPTSWTSIACTAATSLSMYPGSQEEDEHRTTLCSPIPLFCTLRSPYLTVAIL